MKKICVVTVSRADYGLLRWVIKAIDKSPLLELQVLATGGHFSPEQGNTLDEIVNDGVLVSAAVPIVPELTTPLEITRALGKGLSELGQAFSDLAPDCVVLLGDRSETLVAAIAATLAGIPIAHIHGGELTTGAIDDAFRHSITKMSHLHFVAHEEYRRRVIQLGEKPDRVVVVGPMGQESIARMKLLTREEIERELGLAFAKHNLLITMHPETLSPGGSQALVSSVLAALQGLPDTHLFFTAANTDQDGQLINRRIQDFREGNDGAWFFESLGTLRYLSLMAQVDCVVGNSSSGVIEAPVLGVRTIDVGERQSGRIVAHSVTRITSDYHAVLGAIRAGVFTDTLGPNKPKREVPIAPLASETIVTLLEKTDLKSVRDKGFHDLH